MKHEITSMNTKKKLSASLKKFMGHKRLSKISVGEIVADCNVNRKTFYYHFKDIFDLLKWTLEQETVEVLKNFDLLSNPEDALLFVADYVDNNLHILNCAYDSMGRDEMKRFFFADFRGVILDVIGKCEKEQGKEISDKLRKYLSEFYTEALAGILINYFRNKESVSRDELVKYTLLILRVSIPSIIEKADM